jgi:hypothetical protein
MSFIFKAVVLVALGVQTTPLPVRLGDRARQLSDQDVTEIARTVSPNGRPAWLLNGPHGQIPDATLIEAYLPPEESTPELRRGSVVVVVRGPESALAMMGTRPASSEATRQDWTLVGRYSYAQVAVAGRRFEVVEGDGDVNRPFRVSGTFSDRELVSLLQFLRSSPLGPTSGAGTPTQAVHGEWPVVTLVRQPQSMEARLRRVGQELSWESVTLRQQGTAWVIIRIANVFASPSPEARR